MAEEDPSTIVASVLIPRPMTGHRRVVQVSHLAFGGGLNLLTTDANWSDTNQPNYVNYALTPPTGPKQRGIHSKGPSEITWTISGELSNSTMGLMNLMNSLARGVQFSSIHMVQGSITQEPDACALFSNVNGYSLPWSNFTLNGNLNGSVTFTLEGKSLQYPVSSDILASEISFPDVPLPSWFTGNQYVTAWSLSHSVNLTPNWMNTAFSLPGYYRSGHSEFTIQVTTMKALLEHSWIKFGLGGVSIVEAIVTSRNRTFGGRGTPVTYQVTTTNAAVLPDLNRNQNVFGPSPLINIVIPAGPAI